MPLPIAHPLALPMSLGRHEHGTKRRTYQMRDIARICLCNTYDVTPLQSAHLPKCVSLCECACMRVWVILEQVVQGRYKLIHALDVSQPRVELGIHEERSPHFLGGRCWVRWMGIELRVHEECLQHFLGGRCWVSWKGVNAGLGGQALSRWGSVG